MHEFSVVRSLLRDVTAIAAREGAARVTRVRVCVGEFAGIDAELLRLAFEQSVPGTVADHAGLEIEPVPLEARCDRCGREFAVRRFRFACPHCSESRPEIIRGDELILESVGLETES